jgi:hypothetical protein
MAHSKSIYIYKRPLFLNLSRACLGKIIVFNINQKPHPAIRPSRPPWRSVVPRPLVLREGVPVAAQGVRVRPACRLAPNRQRSLCLSVIGGCGV